MEEKTLGTKALLVILGGLSLFVMVAIGLFVYQVTQAAELSPEMEIEYRRWSEQRIAVPEELSNAKPYSEDLLETKNAFHRWVEENKEQYDGAVKVVGSYLNANGRNQKVYTPIRPFVLEVLTRIEPIVNHPDYEFGVWFLLDGAPTWLAEERNSKLLITLPTVLNRMMNAEIHHAAAIEETSSAGETLSLAMTFLKPSPFPNNVQHHIRFAAANELSQTILAAPSAITDHNQFQVVAFSEQEVAAVENLPTDAVAMAFQDHLGTSYTLTKVGFPAVKTEAATGPELLRITGKQTNAYIDKYIVPNGDSQKVQTLRSAANPPIDDDIQMRTMFKIMYPSLEDAALRLGKIAD